MSVGTVKLKIDGVEVNVPGKHDDTESMQKTMV